MCLSANRVDSEAIIRVCTAQCAYLVTERLARLLKLCTQLNVFICQPRGYYCYAHSSVRLSVNRDSSDAIVVVRTAQSVYLLLTERLAKLLLLCTQLNVFIC